MQATLRDAAVRESRVVEQREARGHWCEGCKSAFPGDQGLTLDGNLPGEGKSLASEGHLA